MRTKNLLIEYFVILTATLCIVGCATTSPMATAKTKAVLIENQTPFTLHAGGVIIDPGGTKSVVVVVPLKAFGNRNHLPYDDSPKIHIEAKQKYQFKERRQMMCVPLLNEWSAGECYKKIEPTTTKVIVTEKDF